MPLTHAQSALIKRRDQIAREIRKLKADLAHIDAAIRLMTPGEKLSYGGNGELTRAILAVLRETSGPMTILEIAEAVEAMPLQIKDALKGQRRRGLVRGIQESGKEMVWEVVR